MNCSRCNAEILPTDKFCRSCGTPIPQAVPQYAQYPRAAAPIAQVPKATVDYHEFVHPTDRQALDALKAVPGFDTICKWFMKTFSERTMRISAMSSAVKLSEEQLPRVYKLLPPICKKLEIPIPDFYLQLDVNPNAWTSGDNEPQIIVTTGLLDIMTDEEVQAVIAHECGHIVCHHVLYHPIGNALLNGALLIPGMNPLSIPLQLAFFHWLRCSEFSADRAALAYTEDPDLVARVMMRLAGGTSRIAEEVNLELFLKQAEEYEEYTDVSKWNKTLEFLTLSTMDHPLTAVRATEIEKWSKTPEYQSIITRLNAAKVTQSAAAAVPACPHCGKPIAKSWTFCQSCGKPLAN